MVIWLILVWIVMFAVITYFFYFIRSFFVGTKEAPYVGSFWRQLILMKQKLSLWEWKALIDLWCGDGKALRFFKKNFLVKTIWYDINIFAIFWWKILNRILWYNQIKLIHSNFEKADLSQYDYIYVFLFTKQVSMIEEWIFSNKRADAIVICNTFPCSRQKSYQILTDGKSKIYLYK